MDPLSGKTAVITGAASGFGRELAILCAAEGMNLVLADLDENGLRATQQLVGDAKTLLVACNVAKAESVKSLADQAFSTFGKVHLLFNNAGVAAAGPTWTMTPEDWKWVLDVNLMGVVHGIHSFVPRMLTQGEPAHVVNTASVAGLLSVPGSSVYCVSKHGVVTLSECLHQDLQIAKANIGVSVLCPAYVNTGIANSERNRPAELAATTVEGAAYAERVAKAVRSGKLSATDVAKITMDAVKANRFYILTHPKIKGAIEMRMRDILDDRAPSNPMP